MRVWHPTPSLLKSEVESHTPGTRHSPSPPNHTTTAVPHTSPCPHSHHKHRAPVQHLFSALLAGISWPTRKNVLAQSRKASFVVARPPRLAPQAPLSVSLPHTRELALLACIILEELPSRVPVLTWSSLLNIYAPCLSHQHRTDTQPAALHCQLAHHRNAEEGKPSKASLPCPTWRGQPGHSHD